MGRTAAIGVTVLGFVTEIRIIQVYQHATDNSLLDVIGYLEAGAYNGINGEIAHLFIDGVDVLSEVTHNDPGDTPGYFDFLNYQMTLGTHTVQVKYLGSATYNPSESAVYTVSTTLIPTTLTCSITPLSGSAPLIISVSGQLTETPTGIGIPGTMIDIYMNGVRQGGWYTDASGFYSVGFTLSNPGVVDIYAEFVGSGKYEGC